MRMDAASVLGLLARFTGLHPPAKTLGRRMCQTNGASNRARNSYSGTSPLGAEMLNEAAPHLEHLFAPYGELPPTSDEPAPLPTAPALRPSSSFDLSSISAGELLRELVHPDFGWRRKDHYKRPLNATARARREAEVEGYREHLRKRQANRLMSERRVRAENIAAGKARGRSAGGGGGGRTGKLNGKGKGKGKATGAISPSAEQLERTNRRGLGRGKGKGKAGPRSKRGRGVRARRGADPPAAQS